MPNPTPGTEIGAYRIEGVIGAGSMGDVFRGVDVGLNRRVAVKILSERHKDSNELRARFTREGRAVAAIQHPNVVQVFATGNFQDRPYIAMELLEGTDLASVIDAQGALPALDAAKAILDAAKGLNAAAKAGLIHRDVKPSNLVLLSDGRVKVTDFGLAKPVDPGSEPSLTALGVVVGTPDYIAPEQARGETIDERVDIYALGGTLYFLLCAMPPFRTGVPADDKYLKVVARHLKNPPPDARERNPSADSELADLARQMMAKKPGERPDYATLIRRLDAIINRLNGGGATQTLMPATMDGSSGRLERTPFVGGPEPHGFDDDAAATRSRDPVAAPEVDAGMSELGALTRPAGLPGWLWAVTAIAVIIFGVGLVVHFTRGSSAGGDGGGTASGSAVIVDAGAVEIDAPAPPPLPTAPTGMVLVLKSDGAPWFFVDARPVTAAEYYAAFPKVKKPKGTVNDKPVVMAPYNFAKAYAQTTGKRLLTADEWAAAAITPGVIASPTQLEWVSPAAGKEAPVRAVGKSATRPLAGQKDVTFRLAKDL
ncbi:MAG TPA: protein kinase [Kofleriaceae bacterium]|nr:protein kinase [Kofleriaceae bacterium]